MLTAVIIDDEADALELLALTLKDYFAKEVKVVGQSNLFDEAFLLVKEYQPDLLFLDIVLYICSGAKNVFYTSKYNYST